MYELVSEATRIAEIVGEQSELEIYVTLKTRKFLMKEAGAKRDVE